MEEFVLTGLQLPIFIIDRNSGSLVRANTPAKNVFELDDPEANPISDLVSIDLGLARLVAGLKDEGTTYGTCVIEHEDVSYEAVACRVDETSDYICIILCPLPKGAQEIGKLLSNFDASVPHSGQSIQIEELNKQLHFERLVRQVVSKIYSSLDKDMILQVLVDSLGRALNCQRCLVIIESPTALPVVTHEYAEADISPLGLGRTAKFPVSVFERLMEGVVAVPDVTNLRTVKGVMLEDVNDLLDNSVSSMAGVPMIHRGVAYGVIAALQLGHIRKWDVQDLDLLKICAHHAAISLEHCQHHQRIKDQLFNVNVWSNLTKQLTSTLELATRSPSKSAEKQTRSESSEMPALSSRELEVLKLIASGLANKEIANQLFLTESTVELHASRIRKKLKLRSRTALVKYACDHDIV